MAGYVVIDRGWSPSVYRPPDCSWMARHPEVDCDHIDAMRPTGHPEFNWQVASPDTMPRRTFTASKESQPTRSQRPTHQGARMYEMPRRWCAGLGSVGMIFNIKIASPHFTVRSGIAANYVVFRSSSVSSFESPTTRQLGFVNATPFNRDCRSVARGA
jgi:hypothetical protein